MLFFGANQYTEAQHKEGTKALIEEIDRLEAEAPPKGADFWKAQLKEDKYASNSVAKAKINYLIAKKMVAINLDSAEVYANKALRLLEYLDGFENEKTAVYNGLGNIASAKGKVFLASFYYNKIIAILDANPENPDIPEINKVKFYLHSAQANRVIQLYKSAYLLNKKAEKYVAALPDDSYTKFRVYSQLFTSGVEIDISKDSLKYYLQKAEKYLYSDVARIFFYEHKAQFFQLQGKFDAAQFYSQKVLAFRKEQLANEVTGVHIKNVYASYCNLLANSIQQKNMEEAREYMRKIYAFEQKYASYLNATDQLLFLEAMANYYYETKDLRRYKSTTDSVLVLKDQIQRDAELQAKEEVLAMYQLEENQKSIIKLSRRVKVKENQLETTQFLLIIAVLIVVVVVAGAFGFYYKQKNQKLQQEYKQLALEQKLLRTQMEPHFIFNTLSTLQGLIRFDSAKKAIDYLNHFSRLLRSTLELSRQEVVSLEDELKTLESYLKLQQARFKEKFTYTITTSQEIEREAVFIPPMFLQPFIENSIIHGFKGVENEWQLQISITELRQQNQLKIEIIDNGIGSDASKEKKNKSLSGAITKQRLEILSKKYHIPTDYQVSSVEGQGTKVQLILPILT